MEHTARHDDGITWTNRVVGIRFTNSWDEEWGVAQEVRVEIGPSKSVSIAIEGGFGSFREAWLRKRRMDSEPYLLTEAPAHTYIERKTK